MYSLTDAFTINDKFLEYDPTDGATQPNYPAGTNVAVVEVETVGHGVCAAACWAVAVGGVAVGGGAVGTKGYEVKIVNFNPHAHVIYN